MLSALEAEPGVAEVSRSITSSHQVSPAFTQMAYKNIIFYVCHAIRNVMNHWSR